MPVTPIIIAGTIQVRQHFFCAGVDCEIIQYVKMTGALTQARTDTISDVLVNAWNANTRLYWSDQARWDYTECTDVRTAGAPQFRKNVALVGSSVGGGLHIPTQAAAVITWYTAIRDRSHRGRSYWPGWSESYSAGASPTPALLTALGAYATAIRTNLNTAGFPLAIGSRLLGTSEVVTSHAVRQFWKTQRRRARYG